MRYVFLPGMDGTGMLFEPLLKRMRDEPAPQVIAYPSDRILGYAALESYVTPKLPSTDPYVLVAESFGGPLAARIAAKHPPALRGLVLSATFIRNPREGLGRWSEKLIGPYLFYHPVLHGLARILLAAQGLSEGQIHLILKALDHVPPRLLAARLKEALHVEAFDDLRHCRAPILCLYAERDLLLAKRCRELIARANPKVQLVGLDTPHFLLQAKPDEALRAIRSFVKTLL